MTAVLTTRCCYMSVIFAISVAEASLIVTPQNIAVMSGQEVEMQCQSDDGKKLKWYRQRPGSPKEELIYNGYGFTSHAAGFYKMTNSSHGKYTLRFNASVETAQRYRCLEPGSLDAKSAEMSLLESDPSCDVTRDDAFINITCGVEFHGNWAPTMEWTRYSMDIETQNSLLVSITVISISTIIVTIAVICVTRSCYKRKQRNVTNPDATEIVMLKGGKDNSHRSNKTEESTKQENRRLNRTVLSSV